MTYPQYIKANWKEIGAEIGELREKAMTIPNVKSRNKYYGSEMRLLKNKWFDKWGESK